MENQGPASVSNDMDAQIGFAQPSGAQNGQSGGRPAEMAPDTSYWSEVGRQFLALTKKNFILARRNYVGTFLRIFASFFFILLIFLVNEGLEARFAEETFFKNLPEPETKPIEGIPACVLKHGKEVCWTVAYVPAPKKQYTLDKDFNTVEEFRNDADVVAAQPTCATCTTAMCNSYLPYMAYAQVPDCVVCCEMFRTHKVMRGIQRNGTGPAIPAEKVVGFTSEQELDTFILENLDQVQGAYVFKSPDVDTMTFTVQYNSSGNQIRREWIRPYLDVAVPMQNAAQREVARHFIGNADFPIDASTEEFAHPAFVVASLEGTIAPLFLVGLAMFPFVIQMMEVVLEREYKLRQALSSMGMHDLAYWLSWHVFHSAMAFIAAFLIYAFGCIFQFQIFLKNDFGVIFMVFWLFGQSMIGFGYFVGATLRQSSSSITVGFMTFLLGFALFFMVGLFGFPYGSYRGQLPQSFKQDIVSGNVTWSDSGADKFPEPFLAFFPPTLLIKSVNDLGFLSATDDDDGLRFSERYSYCTMERSCNQSFSIGTIYGWFIGLYLLYSLLALYLDNILPDAMGVKKAPWYFLSPQYWGLGTQAVQDSVNTLPGEESTDEDVVEEEKKIQQFLNQPMDPGNAIEIRGLRQTFTRGAGCCGGGRPFHAVKCPYYGVGKKQLFALLGPNGAGKTTTINMLTGFLPPTAGNAVVFGETIAHPSGMSRVKKMMGVCPQFDILWDALTAREHLELFGNIKGIMPDSIAGEANKRIEEVRLTASSNQPAGTFSGGMKRRLSVAIALIGNPQVVYLDEPTTGMDPINRRHVWDVIEAAKQDRTVILTTHSMEEADILGDRIAIMAKGRLRCLGNSVRLKTRFGAGYRVSISCGDNMNAEMKEVKEIKQMFQEQFQVEVAEESKSYLHFNLPSSEDDKMAGFFTTLEQKKAALNVKDVQLSLSTLEDVFLEIAKKTEKEVAAAENKIAKVTLRNGEVVGVQIGNEEMMASPSGVQFTVKWGTDENGSLIAVDTVELSEQTVMVTVPQGVAPGQSVQVAVKGQSFEVAVPEGKNPGDTFEAKVRVQGGDGVAKSAMSGTTQEQGGVAMSQSDIEQRVKKLQTPYAAQANALFRKNMAFQWTKKCSICCLIVVPIIFLVLVLMLQLLIEVLFLGKNVVRCPYCGPSDDDYGKTYCKGNDCVDFFFPEADAEDFNERFGVDVRQVCKDTQSTCGGNGDPSCFKSEFARGAQFGFCPFPIGVSQPQLFQSTIRNTYDGQPPGGGFLSDTPILYSGDKAEADTIASNLFAGTTTATSTTKTDIKAKLKGAAKSLVNGVFTLMFYVFNDAVTQALNLNCGAQGLSQVQQAAMCKALQHGQMMDIPCCLDLTTATDIAPGAAAGGDFTGSLAYGVNFWSDNPLHTNATYDAFMATCTQADTRPNCNRNIIASWTTQGAIIASGFGMATLDVGIQGLGAAAGINALLLQALNADPDQTKFWCVRPDYNTATEAVTPDNTCFSVDEAMARVASPAAMNFPQQVHHRTNIDSDLSDDFSITIGSGDQETKYFSDTGGRWAQTCDYWNEYLLEKLAAADLNVVPPPCVCLPMYAMKLLAQNMYATAGSSFASQVMNLPNVYSCPKLLTGEYSCGLVPPTTMHPFSIPELKFSTPVWLGSDMFIERALDKDADSWWNRKHVLTANEKSENDKKIEEDAEKDTCIEEKSCWAEAGFGRGSLALLADDCSALPGEFCYLQRVMNMSGIAMECIDAKTKKESKADIDSKTYKGTWNRFTDDPQQLEEFIAAYELEDTDATKLNFVLRFNDTTDFSGGGGPPSAIRLSAPLNALYEAYINFKVNGQRASWVQAGLRAIKEMPQPASFLNLDLGSSIGPFFFSLAFSMLFPVITVALVYEKEQRLRVMMRMMGLGTTAYWSINYLFWFLVYFIFCLVFIVLGSTFSLPSGYKIGLFTRTDGGVHFVTFFGFINNTISLSILWATLTKSATVAQISSVLFLLAMTMIAWTAWDSGNFWNSETVGTDLKNFITIFPFWSFYRAWTEMYEYSFQSALLGVPGLNWDYINSDPRCGMDAVLVSLYLEWPIFLLSALYLDQVLDSGHGVPQHPLFFLGMKYSQDAGADAEAAGGAGDYADVKAEEKRVMEQTGQKDAVIIDKLNKVYPPYLGNPPKVAVKTLTMGVQHGECFGMLGPNGAGKTTTINMLVGFTQPTAGNATVEGFSVLSDMSTIYTLMGVCPQHDVLWGALTARQHMTFYGRLKNLSGAELTQAITDGLRSVNLLNNIDDPAGTFSGGMKRRLSVAISMIGNPLVCYLDEPSTGLDPASRRTLWGCIKEAKKSRAIFLTTHSMEEAEGLCDRLGIFVDGTLRCIGSPKELTSRFGGFFILTITAEASRDSEVSQLVHTMARDVRITYSLAGTQKFEIPSDQLTLAQAFSTITQAKGQLGIKDWGIANTTLEEAFIKISRGAIGT